MSAGITLVQVTAESVDKLGFFCKKSKRKTEGWCAKRAWFDGTCAAGVQTWIALDGKRQVGFIEFAPAEVAWRAVRAPGHLVVHCLWVVGRAKQQGTGAKLLGRCLEEAEARGRGVAVLATTQKGWLVGPGLLARRGLERVATAPPCFELWATTPAGAPTPTLPSDWEARAARFGAGVTLVYTHQCPYVDTLRDTYRQAAEAHGHPYREVFLDDPVKVQEQAPSAYGVVSVVRDGELVAWRWETDKVVARLFGGG